MKSKIIAIASLSMGVLFAGQSFADSSTPKTTADVQKELAEAIRSGNVIADESGKKLNELYPDRYPGQSSRQASQRDNPPLNATGPSDRPTHTTDISPEA